MSIESDIRDILEICRPIPWQSPSAWVGKNIDLSEDRTASSSGMVDLSRTPYLRDPLDFWARENRSKMTVMAVEQTGKSSVWKWGLLWRLSHMPGPSLIVYPSDQDAADTNQDSFEPLMRRLPQFAAELDRPRMKRKDRYSFSMAPIYFSGGGADIISKPFQIVIGDEIDFWVQHLKKVDNLKNLDKRTRTYANALRVIVCSPTDEGAAIEREFKFSSMGFWHLRCLGCSRLSIRSADTFNLKFEFDDDRQVEPDSVRLVCPLCQRGHAEREKPLMIAAGEYVHSRPERFEVHAGFQWGALASTFPGLDWATVANAQLQAGRSGDIRDQKLFDNSFRGLSFIPRKPTDTIENELKKHCAPLPPAAEMVDVLFAADTQDNGWWWLARGIDGRRNTYLASYGFAATKAELLAAWNSMYFDRLPTLGIVNAGGHRPFDVEDILARERSFFAYKGDSRINVRLKPSEDNPRLILAHARRYKSELLAYLYSQQRFDNSYIYLPEEMRHEIAEKNEYLKQMLDMAPNPKKRAGSIYENYVSTGNDHLFDCEKMMLVLVELYLSIRSSGSEKIKKPKVKIET